MKDYAVKNQVSAPVGIGINIIFIILGLSCLLPFLLVVAVSFSDELSVIKNGYQFIPQKFSLDAYTFLLTKQGNVANAYIVTTFVAVFGTFVNVLIVTLYAYPLSRRDFPFKKVFTVFILITMLFNGGFVAQYMVNVTVLHLRNTIWALILPLMGGGFNIFIARTFFQRTIPSELIESSKIDGAGEMTIFLKIILPLSLPILAVLALGNVFDYWNNWTNSLYYITDKNLFTLQYIMQQALRNLQYIQDMVSSGGMDALQAHEQASQLPNETSRMAMVIVGIGPIILVYPFFQKYFIKGLTIGAVKG